MGDLNRQKGKLERVRMSRTVDGRNPAPPGTYKTLYINTWMIYLSTGAGFQPSTVRMSHKKMEPFQKKSIRDKYDCTVDGRENHYLDTLFTFKIKKIAVKTCLSP